MEELEDAELCRRIGGAVRGGTLDERSLASAAEAELVRRFAPRVRLYGLRHLDSVAAADDLVQEVLVTTLEALRAGRVREPERLASFVLGTCRMVVGGQRRVRLRQERLLATYGAVLAPPGRSEPLLDRQRLAECLEHLPERERTVTVLTFYADADAESIARDLSTSPGHVRVIRHRALARLLRCLEPAA